MYEHVYMFESPHRRTAVALPFDLDAMLAGWNALRSQMIRDIPQNFTRDEWAYLASFLDIENLWLPYSQSFGQRTSNTTGQPNILARPRGQVGVWLPNNVSLLGPLILILFSITGNPIHLKGGSMSDDITGAFLDWARNHVACGFLKTYLTDMVRYEVFRQGDDRQREMAAASQVRVVFGSKQAAEAIDSLPHPVESIGISFIDRQSEAWIEKGAVNDSLIFDLLKVFTIYGQAGCTSPRRVVVLNGSDSDAFELCDRLVNLWPKIVKVKPAIHIASQNVMTWQWAIGLGLNAKLAKDHGAVFIVGDDKYQQFDSLISLTVISKSISDAIETLPSNIQTIGHGFMDVNDGRWLGILADTKVKRLVPIGKMHHFSSTWDGQSFWRQAFEEVEIIA